MFKWQHSVLEGMELFPRVVQAPPILRVRINHPPARPDYDYSKESLEQVAQKLLNKHRANIINFSLAQRQQARTAGLPIYKTHRNYPGVFVMYTLQQGTEQLDVTLYPVPPIKKPEEDKCLVVFHDQNKVSAFFMKQLEFQTDNPPTELKLEVTRELQSSWGEELLKAAQYKFDENDGGVAMSPIKIENNQVTRSETHCFVSVKNKFNTFFDTSTLAGATSRVNGSGKIYFTSHDAWEFGQAGLAYIGGQGRSNQPAALSSLGERFYAPQIFGWRSFILESADALETLPLDSPTTPEDANNFYAFWSAGGTYYNNIFLSFATTTDSGNDYLMEVVSTTATLGAVPFLGYPLADSPYGHSNPKAGYFNSNTGGTEFLDSAGVSRHPSYPNLIFGCAGYGVQTESDYATAYKLSTSAETTGTLGNPDGLTPVLTDLNTALPMSVFSQTDGVDVLEVRLPDATSSLSYFEDNDGSDSDRLLASLDFLHLRIRVDFQQTGPSSWNNVGATTPTYPPDLSSSRHPSYAWTVTQPPGFGTDEGQYYFIDNGQLRTPYGEFDIPEGTFDPAENGDLPPFQMHTIYTPWFHLSNGKTYLQAFQIGAEKHIFCKTIEITDMLATACETEVNNIQGCLIDFPLARVKELV